jgi:hypothetical protein
VHRLGIKAPRPRIPDFLLPLESERHGETGKALPLAAYAGEPFPLRQLWRMFTGCAAEHFRVSFLSI